MEDIVNRQFSDLMEPELSDNARYIAETRYGMKGEGGERLEKVKDIFWRVASSVAKGDLAFDKSASAEVLADKQAKKFYQLLAEQKFMPNTPCLVNAGKKHQQMSACFVLPIEDSMESIDSQKRRGNRFFLFPAATKRGLYCQFRGNDSGAGVVYAGL